MPFAMNSAVTFAMTFAMNATRPLLAALLVALSSMARAAEAPADGPAAAESQKVLHIALRTSETGFDPAQISDLYSRTIASHIFEAPYTYDHLARPYKIKPATADGMPESSPDFKVWTVKLKRGIYFADDPAFNGKKRELIAEDYVYALKRFADPAVKSPAYTSFAEESVVGLEDVRNAAIKTKRPFDYDRRVEGVVALDRYTLRFTLGKPRPRFITFLAQTDLFNGVAREVVERYGADIMAHPVGTGPYLLKQWRRSSLIVLERNPNYRERYYDAEPAADDAEGQALLARFKGRRLPLTDRIEVNVIEESQPRWLAFLNGQVDLIDPVPSDLAKAAVPGGKLAPNLVKKGISAHRMVNSDVGFLYYNMEDPIVGGYTPEKIALRRAINLSFDVATETRLIRNGMAIPAQAGNVPNTYGYDPEFKSTNSEYSPARAKALLDMYGYVDKNGDGWREMPDGSPLVLEMASSPDQLTRQIDDLRRKNLTAIGIKANLRIQQWSENLKAAHAGKLMVWALAGSAAGPDGQDGLGRIDSSQFGGSNFARFKVDAVDKLYGQLSVMPDGPERLALFQEINRIVTVYAPYKYISHRIYVDLTQPWLSGYRRPLFWQEQWMFMDVDMALRAKALK